jgi:hypothetical protein
MGGLSSGVPFHIKNRRNQFLGNVKKGLVWKYWGSLKIGFPLYIMAYNGHNLSQGSFLNMFISYGNAWSSLQALSLSAVIQCLKCKDGNNEKDLSMCTQLHFVTGTLIRSLYYEHAYIFFQSAYYIYLCNIADIHQSLHHKSSWHSGG